MADLDGLALAVRAVPDLDPHVAFGAVQTAPNAQEAATTAMSLHAFGTATRWRNYLQGLPDDEQLAHWSSRSPSERALLTGAGYKPPSVHHAGHGLFDRVLGAVGHGVEQFGAVPAHVIGDVLHVAGAPLRFSQHLYRAAALVDESVPNHGWSPQIVGHLFNPDDWAKAWHESVHGEQTFIPSAVRDVESRYDTTIANLARQLAGGTKLDDLAQRTPEEQRQAFIDLARSPEVSDAVRRLAAAKISVGRRVVGEHLMYEHPALAHAVSGTLDAVADWYGDPTVGLSKVVKGVEVARYGINGVEDLAKVRLPGVQRAIGLADEALTRGGEDTPARIASLIRRFPQLTPAAEEMVRYGVRDGETFGNWLADENRLQDIIAEKAGAASAPVPMLLHTGRLGEIGLRMSERIGEAVDWAKTAGGIPLAPVRGAAQMTKYLSTLTHAREVDLASDNAVREIQRFADSALSRQNADKLVESYLAASPGKKREVFQNLTEEVLQHSGWKPDDVSRYMGLLRESAERRAYAATVGADAVVRDGGTLSNAGFRAQHLSDTWSLPSYRMLKRLGTRDNLMESFFGAINRDGIDSFMEHAWKPTTLLRLGFPVRAGGEELVGAVMREGLRPILQARLAGSAVGGERAAQTVEDVASELERGGMNRLAARTEAINRVQAARAETSQPFYVLPFHPLKATFDALTDHLPDQVRDAMRTPGDFAGAVFGDRARRAFRNVEGKLAGETYYNRAKELFDNGYLVGGLAHEISAVHTPGAGYTDPYSELREGNARKAMLIDTGNYQHYQPEQEMFAAHWRTSLDEARTDPITRAALSAGTRDEQVQAVADFLENHEALARRGERFFRDRQGRLVASGEITQRQALEDWAHVVVDDLHQLTAPNGVPVEIGGQTLLDRMRTNQPMPTAKELDTIPVDARPSAVKGPELMLTTRNPIREIMNNGFARIVGAPMDWMTRQPLFIHEYAKAAERLERALEPLGVAKSSIVDAAVDTAVRKMVPFIHDPNQRSQMAVLGRNLSPFWFAQEQFVKRWARTFRHSPEAFREAQLVMSGIRHAGFIHTDDNGNDYFMYPLVGQTQTLLSKAYERFTGHKIAIPLPVGFSGQVRFATPGTERLGLPSAGPLVGIGMHALADRFPELQGLEQGFLGERGSGRAYWEQILPTTVTRLIHAAADHPDSSPQMASAMMQAMSYLEATGHAPPDNATPIEIERYQDRVKNWTRILFFNRLLFGYSVPAAPELQMDPNHLHEEFRHLLAQLPIEDATKEFLKRHPDASAYTVFQSKSQSGAPLPATEGAVRFMENNRDFLKSYPAAAGWFIPQSKDKKFSQSAYREQLSLELRNRRTPEEFYRQLKFQEAADQYFRTKDQVDVALAHAGPARKRQIQAQYQIAKQAFLAAHPVFADELASRDGQRRRQETVEQLRSALNDPRLPDTSTTTALKEMLASFDAWQALRQRLSVSNTAAARSQRQAVDNAFIGAGTTYVRDHPEAKGFWDRIVRVAVEEQ